ncbi:MAG: nucleoside-diphosphate-sugar pyrophosphorylase [Desulfobacterales bacterium RIFOXYA12_FULL_46_15]|nr:MAG: nucleoside-diphosphate-sugar pyrophosphorylase [Desulfobacula sp. GWF2_41_7]OGR25031.1 MAG: nucleoside-diphosphate-sugar pyrophosphorylase [Desulfobacterales bacterium RIFOXYA12_FULL_46_15]
MNMNFDDIGVVILAAGKGTRMKSDTAKVLHKVAQKSMIIHVIERALEIVSADSIHVVVGHQAEQVKEEIHKYYQVNYAYQTHLLGTGDAVKVAIPGLASRIKDVLVLYGDVPLIKEETLFMLVEAHKKSGAKITVLATEVDNPKGYGRIILDHCNHLLCIREEADATEAEKRINKVNSGIYCFDKDLLVSALNEISPENSQGEYYLTDVIEIAQKKNQIITVVVIEDSRQVIGVNTLEELDRAEYLIQGLAYELP